MSPTTTPKVTTESEPLPEDITQLSDEEKAERYQDAQPPKDPNTPASPDDPNDRIRAEGPEVADPAKVAAHAAFDLADFPEEGVTPEPDPTEEAAKATATAAIEGSETKPPVNPPVTGAEPEPIPVTVVPEKEPTPTS